MSRSACPSLRQSVKRGEVEICKDLLLLGCEEEGCVWRGEHGLQARELLVKVAHVTRGFDARQERRLHSLG